MRKGFIQITRILGVTSALLLIFVLFLSLNRSLPPVKEFRAYHSLISTLLEEAEVNINLEAYDTARLFFDRAYDEWKEENTRFMLLRDYSESKRLVLIALSLAEEAKFNNADKPEDLSSQDLQIEKIEGKE